ncbi:MAG: HAMP domain-containing histidine kinase [Lachnospiraceae bacterium]|nr:HAMP domain-containing histidine kinase [Lachnospiraceae bacterium]
MLYGSMVIILGIFLSSYGWAGVAASCACILVCAFLHLWDIRTRNKKIAEMTREIDVLLHEGKRLDIVRYQEGELSLLANEIGKMTVRLEEQADSLKADKTCLADSMADISHQIRTPLTSMYLHLEAVSQSCGDVQEQKRHLREIRRLQDQIDWLISTLLKLAKLDAGTIVMKPEPVPLEELAKRAAAPMEILMDLKNQRLVIDASGTVVADRSWTEEAVRNIVKNCVEHMEEGILSITARENPIYSELVIRDTGPGISKEDLPHLFERFYKGKNSSEQSVGIGLSLSRMIIASQGGTLRAQNHPEGGAMFEIRIYKS